MEIIFEVLFEIVVQCGFEFLAELGVKSVFKATGYYKPKSPILSPILSAMGYVILSTIGAGISLKIYPDHFIKDLHFRILNLAFAPLLVGMFMGFRGRSLRNKEMEVIRLDSFIYGWLFALVFAAIRFQYAH